MFGKPEPEEVFTPRSHKINPDMYINRLMHERRLKSALGSGKSVIIHGDSGCGKSWLYRKVLSSERYVVITIDLYDCIDSGTLETAFEKIMTRGLSTIVEGENRVKKIGAEPYGIGGSAELQTRSVSLRNYDLVSFLAWLREKHGRKKICVVFENLEQVQEVSHIVEQLRNVVMRIDDPEIAEYRIKILFVGVDSFFDFLSSGNRRAISVSNRTYEVPEVGRMDEEECLELIHRGLVEQLNYKVVDASRCVKTILYYTDRVPQYLQDLCLHVAQWAEENNGIILLDLIHEATHDWIDSFLQQEISALSSIFGANQVSGLRTSQVIYAITICDKREFSIRDIECIVRSEFPISTGCKKLALRPIIRNLSKKESYLVRPLKRDGWYRMADAKSKIVLRSCLYKDVDEETVEFSISGDHETYIDDIIADFAFSDYD